MPRPDGRPEDRIRPLRFERDFAGSNGGSVRVVWGSTQLLCSASIEDGVPDPAAGE